ncbi:uncharacterized protein LOC131651420 [Vicia villosa]|uniref:uncharacterized protein LOC131651420 n=1 Tax=Vicia villosa TaxID=3911 RepID=UPI00273C691B|nr:uncharacterized protein LOC131651420 [Vicia villosa]
MLVAFAETWLPETSSFHLPHVEIIITMDDIACLLHLPIRGILLSHGRLTKEEAMKILIEELEVDLVDALEEVERTREVHGRFHAFQHIYDEELLAVHQSTSEEAETDIHRERVLRTYLLYFLRHSALCGYELDVHRRRLRDILIRPHTCPLEYYNTPPILLVGERCRVTLRTYRVPKPSSPLRGNQVSDPYRHCLDRMAAEDIHFDCYTDHHETVPFDEIVLYCVWLDANSTIIVRYLLKRVMRQFGYQQTIPRLPSDSAPIAMTRWQLEEVFADWKHHLVPAEARETTSERDWSCVDGYIT